MKIETLNTPCQVKPVQSPLNVCEPPPWYEFGRTSLPRYLGQRYHPLFGYAGVGSRVGVHLLLPTLPSTLFGGGLRRATIPQNPVLEEREVRCPQRHARGQLAVSEIRALRTASAGPGPTMSFEAYVRVQPRLQHYNDVSAPRRWRTLRGVSRAGRRALVFTTALLLPAMN